MPRAHALQREATAMRSPRTATKSSPRSPQLEKACAQQRRPNAAKKKARFKRIKWFPNNPIQYKAQGYFLELLKYKRRRRGRRRRRKREVEEGNKVDFTTSDIQSTITRLANKSCFTLFERCCYGLNCLPKRYVEAPTPRDENHKSKLVIN